MRVPANYEVKSLRRNSKAWKVAYDRRSLCTCGTCGRSWDDDIVTGITPVPSARCPFEYYHGSAS